MDASRFDAWTRRQFGLLTGGLAAALLGVASLADAEAKKKKKKCKKLEAKCSPNNKKKRCCSGIACEDFPGAGFFCCHTAGKPCSIGQADEDCCPGFFCNDDNVCESLCPSCRLLNESCGNGCECCGELACVDGDCCFTAGTDCEFGADCCGTLTCQDGICAQ